MGLTKVKVLVVNPDSGANAEVELIVDTGSIFTWIDGRVLEGIGVRPRRVRSFRTIDGRVVSRRVGVATIRYGEYEGDAQVLGATALETLGLEVDSLTGTLRYVGHLAV